MAANNHFDVIIVGGSYAGLAAGMALGRALRKVLIIDNGKPCNRQTPHSHNFLTHDGRPPGEIANLARQQVQLYKTIRFLQGLAVHGIITADGFEITLDSGEIFRAKKLIFATGITDIMPDIEGFATSWGISVLHCPYCHGYEVRNQKTGILGNGDNGFELTKLISNWTKDLTVFTNGPSTFTDEQTTKIEKHRINIEQEEIEKFEHAEGFLQNIILRDGRKYPVQAVYTRPPFQQHCDMPESLGCELTEEGYIKTDAFQQTTVKGIFACGDNATRMRTVAYAIAQGTVTGIAANKELIEEYF